MVLALEGLIGLHRAIPASASLASVVGVKDLDYCDIEWFALETKGDYFVVFETVPKYYILDYFIDYEGYSISSQGFLPQ